MTDEVQRRITIDYGLEHVYVVMHDASGRIVGDAEETFRQPFRLERPESHQEARDCFDAVYQWLSDTIVWPLPEPGSEPPESSA